MIKITFYSISIGADISSYADGDWDLDCLYVLDSRGIVCEELPAHMLTATADREIHGLIQKALDELEPDCDGPDSPEAPEYFFRGVRC
jgi:hypothetical protein